MGATVSINRGAIQAMVQRGGAVSNDMERRARRVESVSKGRAPVDTGRMRAAGLVVEGSVPGSWDVVFPVNYSIYVDQGTIYMVARPFLSGSIQAAVQ